jgi:hypothetical protein
MPDMDETKEFKPLFADSPLECESCHAVSARVRIETVSGRGEGWKCPLCRWWNWLVTR